MNSPNCSRIRICAAVVLAFAPVVFASAAAEPAKPKHQHYSGKVVPVKDLLEKSGITLDKDAAANSLALVTDDGKTYPLVKDASSRMFFSDPAVLNRRMRLTGNLVGDTPFLKVLQIHSYVKGELHDIYYWCDICSIKRFEKMQCECCQGPMELRETPVKK